MKGVGLVSEPKSEKALERVVEEMVRRATAMAVTPHGAIDPWFRDQAFELAAFGMLALSAGLVSEPKTRKTR